MHSQTLGRCRNVIAYLTTMLAARIFVDIFHVSLDTFGAAQPFETYLALFGLLVGAYLVRVIILNVFFKSIFCLELVTTDITDRIIHFTVR